MTEAVETFRERVLDARYTLLDRLGAGGQGEVWRAHDGTRGVDIAIKLVKPAPGREDDAWKALEHEYAIASKLEHPSILKVFAPERIGDSLVLPMELASGGDLRRLRGAGFLEIIPSLLEIAQALEHAHERGVVHRDLKPGNVLFDARGRARLADFGVAEHAMTAVEASDSATNATGSATTPTRDTNRHGFSPFTASPAQLRGEPPTPADDIYGLGALAYELLSGYPPYYPHFDKKRAMEERVPMLVPTRQIPPLLGTLVMNMLAKNPKRRPRTMREVIDELDASLNDTLTYDFENVSPATPTGSVAIQAAAERALQEAGGSRSSLGDPSADANMSDAGRPSSWTPDSRDRRRSNDRRGRRKEDLEPGNDGEPDGRRSREAAEGHTASGAREAANGAAASGAREAANGQAPSGVHEDGSGHTASGAREAANGRTALGTREDATGHTVSGVREAGNGRAASGAREDASGHTVSGVREAGNGRAASGAREDASSHTGSGAGEAANGRTASGVREDANGHAGSGVREAANGRTAFGVREAADVASASTGGDSAIGDDAGLGGVSGAASAVGASQSTRAPHASFGARSVGEPASVDESDGDDLDDDELGDSSRASGARPRATPSLAPVIREPRILSRTHEGREYISPSAAGEFTSASEPLRVQTRYDEATQQLPILSLDATQKLPPISLESLDAETLARLGADLDRAEAEPFPRPTPGRTSPMTPEKAAAIVAAARAASSQSAARPTTTHILAPAAPAKLIPASSLDSSTSGRYRAPSRDTGASGDYRAPSRDAVATDSHGAVSGDAGASGTHRTGSRDHGMAGSNGVASHDAGASGAHRTVSRDGGATGSHGVGSRDAGASGAYRTVSRDGGATGSHGVASRDAGASGAQRTVSRDGGATGSHGVASRDAGASGTHRTVSRDGGATGSYAVAGTVLGQHPAGSLGDTMSGQAPRVSNSSTATHDQSAAAVRTPVGAADSMSAHGLAGANIFAEAAVGKGTYAGALSGPDPSPIAVDTGPIHATWDIPLDGLPKVARLEPIRPRRWPWVFLGVLAGAAAAVYFWLPRFDTRELPPEVAAVVTPLQTAIEQSSASIAAVAGNKASSSPTADQTGTAPISGADAATVGTATAGETGSSVGSGRSGAGALGKYGASGGSGTSASHGTNSDVPTASAATVAATAGPAVSNEQRLRDMRQTFDTRIAALEARGAGAWGGREFAMAKTRAAESVGAHDAGNARVAQEKLDAAMKLLDTVDGRAPQALSSQVAVGEKALGAGQQEVAGQAFDLARRINPADRRATDGQRRAQNLNAVLPLLADAQNAEADHDYARAAQDYSQALSLDPGNATAKAGQLRANASFGDDNYAKAVGTGFAALGAGRLDEAHEAFVKARALKPNSAEASEGLRRVSAALTARGFASMRQRALGLEAQERWEEAERVYEDVLAADPSLAFAQEGKARTTSRADLSLRLQQFLDRPDRLSTAAVREDARALLETARAQSPQGPVIRSQIARLELLLPGFDRPVRLSLVSDNTTQIVIPSIGAFGTFARRDIELRPGKYTVVGTRNGFRDVRQEITVAPGQGSQIIRVSCSDPI